MFSIIYCVRNTGALMAEMHDLGNWNLNLMP